MSLTKTHDRMKKGDPNYTIITKTTSITTNTTVSGIVEFSPDAMYTVASGVTLTLDSPASIKAQPNQQIFTGDGSISFTLPGIIHAGWFQVSGSGTSADKYIIDFDAIETAAALGSTLHTQAGVYYQISDPPWEITNIKNLTGRGIIYNAATGGEVAIQTADGVGDDYFNAKDVTIQGNGSSGAGLWLNDTRRWLLDNVIITGNGGDGLLVEDESWIGEAHNCFFINNGGDGVETKFATGGVLGVNFLSCNASGNTGNGYHINSTATLDGNVCNIIGGTVESNGINGIKISRTKSVNIDGVYLEGNITAGIDLLGLLSTNNAMLRNIGGGSVVNILISDGVNTIDGLKTFEDGKVLTIISESPYEVKNFNMVVSTTTDPPYIRESGRVNSGLNGTGNRIRNGNFLSWKWEQDRPTFWNAVGTATYTKDTPPYFNSGDALKITAGSDTSGLEQSVATLTAKSTLTVSFWAKATSGDTAVMKLSDNGTSPQSKTLEITDTSYKRYTMQHIASTGSTAISIQPYAKTNGDIVWFSEIQATLNADIKGWLSNELDIRDIAIQRTINRLDEDATPSVKGGELFITRGTTTVTDFDDGVPGQEIKILFDHSKTITDGTNIFLKGSTDFNGVAGDTLSLIQKDDGLWYQTGGSDN